MDFDVHLTKFFDMISLGLTRKTEKTQETCQENREKIVKGKKNLGET